MLKLVKAITPPIVWNSLRTLKRSQYQGSFDTYEEAISHCIGYNVQEAVNYAIRETEKIKPGVMDDRSMRLLAALGYIALRLGGLKVLDFGGSLGGHYLMFKNLLPIEEWRVCELPLMTEAGKKYTDEVLGFTNSISGQPNVVLLSGSLQYCRDPYKTLSEILSLTPAYLLFDRVPFGTKRLCIQNVPTELYSASFPMWFLDKQELISSSGDVALEWNEGFLISCRTPQR